MANAEIETKKRIAIATKECDKFRDSSLAAVLTGSAAYSPNLNVTEKSDIDLVIITKDLKKIADTLFDKDEAKILRNRFFEGYCIKKEKENIPISIHILSNDSFDIISKCFVADIRIYRPECKGGNYILKGFEGNIYNYYIKNIKLSELKGVRTIVPISFINKDRYYLGIHRDKLLSNPKIMHEKESYASRKIDKLWKVVAENLIDESCRIYGKVDLKKMNILNALAKKDKMSEDVKSLIEDKTIFYVDSVK